MARKPSCDDICLRRYFGNNGLAVRPRIINFKGSFTLGVDGRAKGAVRSKAEPWNERRVKNVSLSAKETRPSMGCCKPLGSEQTGGSTKLPFVVPLELSNTLLVVPSGPA